MGSNAHNGTHIGTHRSKGSTARRRIASDRHNSSLHAVHAQVSVRLDEGNGVPLSARTNQMPRDRKDSEISTGVHTIILHFCAPSMRLNSATRAAPCTIPHTEAHMKMYA